MFLKMQYNNEKSMKEPNGIKIIRMAINTYVLFIRVEKLLYVCK